ncbi:MAG: VapC toxin family PIN domain ribonuclease [Vulcanimicrobiaceae bacterium]
MTALAFLRFLTNPRIVGSAVLDGGGAWRAMRTWLSTPGVQWLDEPAALDQLLGHWSAELDIRGADWNDAYLAAFASTSGCRLVAFDGDYVRFPSLKFLHLSP